MTKRAPDLHDDPLSAASAALVALGIDRARRLDVLDVLGCLIDHADTSGEVVLDRWLFAHEVELGVDKCLDAYALLEQLSIVRRSYRGWVIAGFAAHQGPKGETAASLAVLRRHLASVGAAVAMTGPAFEAQTPAPGLVAALSTRQRLRRARTIAVGLAASAAVVVGASQFVPQAAVSGRNVVQNSDTPATTMRSVSPQATTPVGGVATSSPSAAAARVTTMLDPTTTVNAPAPGAACRAPEVVTAITSVAVVRLVVGGIWSAVITGTATLTNSDAAVSLPALQVVAHTAEGDTAPVPATLAAPTLRPNKSAPFNAIVPLGSVKPTETVTATATAAGLPAC